MGERRGRGEGVGKSEKGEANSGAKEKINITEGGGAIENEKELKGERREKEEDD